VARPGEAVREGDTVAILESMKMEIAVKAGCDGVLTEWLVAEGKPVAAGQHIAVFTATQLQPN
jgi:urea carboxylase